MSKKSPTLEKRSPSTPKRHVIFPFHYDPSQRTVFVAASISDEPGTLAALLVLLSKRVNLIGTSSYALGGNAATFSCFGKLLSAGTTAATLQAELIASAKVVSCQVWESKEGLIVDRFHTGFEAGVGEPYVVFPNRGLSDTFEGVVRVFGSGGSTLLYDLGLSYAKARAAVYKRVIGSHPESRIDELASIVTALGYGLSAAAFDPNHEALRLTSRECFECSTPSECKRQCSFLRGMAVGIFGPLFGLEVVGEETKCRHLEDDFCEFVIRAKDGRPLVR